MRIDSAAQHVIQADTAKLRGFIPALGLSHRYEGTDYTYTPGQVRVRYVIAIERADVYDG
jgi:hypothetical protein